MRAWAMLAAAGGLIGCSPAVLQPDACTDNAGCREAFGRGWTCSDGGRCEAPVADPRCMSIPEGILADPGAHEDRFLLGSMFVPGGVFQPMVQAARLAVLQVNDHNGLDGREFGIIECSVDEGFGDGLDANAATAHVARYLADDLGIPAVVGPATSTRTEIAYNMLSPLGTVLASPSATSPSLTPLDGTSPSDADPGLLWRTAPPDDLQGRAIAAEMVENLGASKAAVLHQTGAYGAGLAAVFVQFFTEGGGRTASQYPFATPTDLASGIAQVAGEAEAGELDQVLVISSDPADVISFLDAAGGDARFDGVGIFLTDGSRTNLLFDPPGQAREAFFADGRVRGTVPKTPVGRQVYDTFAFNYRLLFADEPDDFGFTAHAYDAAWILLYGTAWAHYQEGGVTGVGVARGLRRLSQGQDVRVEPAEWNEVKGQFEAGRSVNIDGASGALDFAPLTEETTAPVDVWRVVPSGNGFGFDETHCWDFGADPGECDGEPPEGDDDDSAD